MKSIKVLILAVFCLISYNTIAQTTKKHILNNATRSTTKIFSKSDSNKDSFISKTEIESSNGYVSKFFDKIDINKDGKVSIEECKQYKIQDIQVIESQLKKGLKKEFTKGGVPLKRFGLLDNNKDNIISQKEFFKRQIMLSDDFTMRSVDLDGDRNISFKEFKKSFRYWLNPETFRKPQQQRQQRQRREVYIPKPRFNYEKFTAEELLKKFDTSGNNQIEREEAKLENSFNTDFSRMDVNGDEEVDKKELTKYLGKLKK